MHSVRYPARITAVTLALLGFASLLWPVKELLDTIDIALDRNVPAFGPTVRERISRSAGQMLAPVACICLSALTWMVVDLHRMRTGPGGTPAS